MSILVDLSKTGIRNLTILGGQWSRSEYSGGKFSFRVELAPEEPGGTEMDSWLSLSLVHDVFSREPNVYPLGKFKFGSVRYSFEHVYVKSTDPLRIHGYRYLFEQGYITALLEQTMDLQLELKPDDDLIIARCWLNILQGNTELQFQTEFPYADYQYLFRVDRKPELAKTA